MTDLSAIEFDSVFTINDDLSVSERNDLHSPDLFDDEVQSDEWSFFSHGYTGQHGYNGPIMHNSETFSGSLLSDVLSTPGTYVLVVSYYDNDDEEMSDAEPTIAEGWAVLRLND